MSLSVMWRERETGRVNKWRRTTVRSVWRGERGSEGEEKGGRCARCRKRGRGKVEREEKKD